MSEGPRETVYDDQISPLMTKVIALCKEHDIPCVCQFELDPDEERDGEHLLCTTAIVPEHASDQLKKMSATARSTSSGSFAAFTIVRSEKP